MLDFRMFVKWLTEATRIIIKLMSCHDGSISIVKTRRDRHAANDANIS